MNHKVAASVILYNADESVVDNIKSYIDYIDFLYVVDNGNSEKVINILATMFPDKQKIIKHTENFGIARSLNEVLRDAYDKFDLLLTMDQDSRFYNENMRIYRNEVNKFDWNKTLALGASVVGYDFVSSDDVQIVWKPTECMITSGNIISVKNTLSIGEFNEELFIDEVDSEFVYRGRKANFDVIINVSGIYLLHSLGNPSFHKLLGHITKVQNHNKIRKYYIFRNRLVVLSRYWKFIGFKRSWNCYIKANLDLIRDVIFFEDDKNEKLKYIILGLKDFLTNRLGKRF